ncbi:MAG: Rpn family recombination-promoting nuclease/putative transposase [Lautropia sp.]|nr:Rpn family recombination-promoting nuclease/putative transposase [Lautropia sp.]
MSLSDAHSDASADARPDAGSASRSDNRADDASYKLLFSSPELVRDLVLGFIPDEWLHSLDYATLEKVPGSYVTDDLRHRADDVIWRVRTGEDWIYLYLLIEFQSRPDRWMAVRMMTYVGLLYQDLIRRGELVPGAQAGVTRAALAPEEPVQGEVISPASAGSAQATPASSQPGQDKLAQRGRKPARRLPPVLPIVFYNGSARWTAATDIAQLVPKAPGLVAQYLPRMQYLLLDQARLARRADLGRLKNLVAAVVRVEYPENEQALITLVDELNEWLDGQPELKRTFAIWIRAVLLRRHDHAWALPKVNDLKELKMGLTRQIDRWAQVHQQKGHEEGLQEGLQKGLQKGHAAGAQQAQTLILQRLIAKRFGELPKPTLQRIQEASPQQLEAWIDRVLDARTLDEVFANR